MVHQKDIFQPTKIGERKNKTWQHQCFDHFRQLEKRKFSFPARRGEGKYAFRMKQQNSRRKPRNLFWGTEEEVGMLENMGHVFPNPLLAAGAPFTPPPPLLRPLLCIVGEKNFYQFDHNFSPPDIPPPHAAALSRPLRRPAWGRCGSRRRATSSTAPGAVSPPPPPLPVFPLASAALVSSSGRAELSL